MPYTKGKSGNPTGKKPGTRSRTTSEIQKAFLELLDFNLKNLQDDLDSLPSKDRATILISLAKHMTPPAMNPETLTETQLQQVVEYLKKAQQ